MKISKSIKLIVAAMLMFSYCLNSFAAVVSENDGTTFVTKGEFDKLKSDFSKQINNYNDSLTNKIDGAIASYLSGFASVERECNTMLPNFSYPLYIVNKDSEALVANTSGTRANSLYYAPEETMRLMYGAQKTSPGAGGNRYFYYKYTIPARYHSTLGDKLDLYDGTLSTDGSDDVLLLSNYYNNAKVNIDISAGLGGTYWQVGKNAVKLALAFDETSTETVPTGGATTVITITTKNTVTARSCVADFNRLYQNTRHAYKFKCRYYYGARFNDETIYFPNIDNWGGTSSVALYSATAAADIFQNQVISYTLTYDSSQPINRVLNYSTLYLPVSVDGNIAFSNNKNWRQLYRPWTDTTLGYECLDYQTESGTSAVTPADTTTLENLPLQAVATPGWGMFHEGNIPTSLASTYTWKDTSIMKSEHIRINVTDNSTGTTEMYKLHEGIPLWHVDKDGNCILRLNIDGVDAAHPPVLYVSRNILRDGPTNYLATDLYDLEMGTVKAKNLTLSSGTNTININEVKKGEMMYFKILSDSDDDVILKEAPKLTMMN